MATTSLIEPTPNKGIIGLGGSSKHYEFDDELVSKQIEYVLTTHPHHHFHIYNSRRTPSALSQAIKDMTEEFQNFTFIDFESPEAKSFQEDLQTSELKFVTPDSSNLVFEALSCKGKTYVMQIERLVRSKTSGSKKLEMPSMLWWPIIKWELLLLTHPLKVSKFMQWNILSLD